MVKGVDIRALSYDMDLIGLDIHKNQDIKDFIKRLEKSLLTAKFCLDKPAVVDAATFLEE